MQNRYKTRHPPDHRGFSNPLDAAPEVFGSPKSEGTGDDRVGCSRRAECCLTEIPVILPSSVSVQPNISGRRSALAWPRTLQTITSVSPSSREMPPSLIVVEDTMVAGPRWSRDPAHCRPRVRSSASRPSRAVCTPVRRWHGEPYPQLPADGDVSVRSRSYRRPACRPLNTKTWRSAGGNARIACTNIGFPDTGDQRLGYPVAGIAEAPAHPGQGQVIVPLDRFSGGRSLSDAAARYRNVRDQVPVFGDVLPAFPIA